MPVPYTSRAVLIGGLTLGGGAPVRIQSMASSDSCAIDQTVDQCIRMIAAGAELVRLTTQGSREVQCLGTVRQKLRKKGYSTPVIADVHFRPEVAVEAARHADKVRINPGNFLRGTNLDSTFPALLDVCREYGTALRIGVNHGSLSREILEKYGDTPEGMVESAMRFLRECKNRGMEKVVVSLKSSNPLVMIHSVRLLADSMAGEGMQYPLHLGVTEAGDGTDGRIKSVAGLAPLLLGGLGDTIRVSLTEPPENELPVARMITRLFSSPPPESMQDLSSPAPDRFRYQRRKSAWSCGMGAASPVKIISSFPPDPEQDLLPGSVGSAISYDSWNRDPAILANNAPLLLEHDRVHILELVARLNRFCLANTRSPVIYKAVSQEKDADLFQMRLAGELSALLVGGAIDAVQVENPHHSEAFINQTLLAILQATRSRISKMEYIACPSCGRTHFDILSRLKEIRLATSHLAPLKIGVMGCIVNGPGEMADADYGYVGAGRGRITLYRRQEPVRKNIPESEALDALIELIKKEGDWKEPPETP